MIGEILDGKYRIDRQLGAGGMGNVYLSTHLGTTRIVAVKVIAPRWASDPNFLARFQREAQACGRLRHPNIVNVTDFGLARSSRGDMAYLVMEFLDGLTLSDFQKENPRPPLPLIADLLDQIALALDEAHRHGIVHRDLKPDNIWLEPNGRGGYTVKVLDFGVAKMNQPGLPAVSLKEAPIAIPATLSGGEQETLVMPGAPSGEAATVAMPSTPSGSFDSGTEGHTMPGSLVGTPSYMSPEQALGKEIDFRSDIYSLAVVAYGLVCGELPFRGKTSELFAYHQTGQPRPPHTVCKVPRDVSEAVLAGLARKPEDRPLSPVAFSRRFRNAVDAEFLALRRSKAFLVQHLGAYALLMIPIYGIVMSLTALLAYAARKVVPTAALRILVMTAISAALLIFFDNVLRASAALMALDEQVRIRRFLSFRVFWKLLKMLPVLFRTQLRSWRSWGPGWVVGDCLWPVICTVEQRTGRAAIERSRELMAGLRSAGRALAIRHLALAALSMGELIRSFGILLRRGIYDNPDVVVTSTWYPIFALFAAAPLFLYDRTAANQGGPLLQLDRTPEIRITARSLSLSSTIWLVLGAIYVLYEPLKAWIFGK